METKSELYRRISGYVDPNLIITKECPICEETFESPRFYGKRYCSPKCRRRAKNFRESNRHKDLEQSVLNPQSRFFMTITNPSTEQIYKCAKLIRDEITNDKPILFRGLIPPNLHLPDVAVVFQKQQKLNETDIDEYVMLHPAMLE